jgi:ankyrin repeat protein
MSALPSRADLGHLKKQAKTLLRLYRNGDPGAIKRFAANLPAAANRSSDEILALQLRLHDAQSCLAREYGFPSWADLTLHVAAAAFARDPQDDRVRNWLALAYGGDVTGSYDAPKPRLAVHLWNQQSDRFGGNLSIACAAGDTKLVAGAISADPDWVNRPLGPFQLPPLVAVTHSRLAALPDFQPRLRACAQALLRAGADPNQRIFNRYPPASLNALDENGPLSALYGAAGVNRDPVLTKMLLDAGADPNDGESLYHSLERPECTLVLLCRGAQVAGTNALRRALDMKEAAALELLLAHGADPNEAPGQGPTGVWGAPLLRAIAVRCSTRHIEALLAAGADPQARTSDGVTAYRLALQAGLVDVAELLHAAGAAEPLTPQDEFIAACSRGDMTTARRVQNQHPELPGSLPANQLRLLPDAAAWGSTEAVKTMVECGWPLSAQGGDWNATALNHAVMRGDPNLTSFLLARGANWREQHGYGSDVLGTLSWASVNEPTHTIDHPNWAGCARALVESGLPEATADPADPERLLIDGRPMRFSEEVAEALLARGSARVPQRPI